MIWTSRVDGKYRAIAPPYTSKYMVVARTCGLPTAWNKVRHPRAAYSTTAVLGRARMFAYVVARPHDAAESRVNGD